MTGSPLVTKVIPAHTNNYTAGRMNNGKMTAISEIVVHHMAANSSIESVGAGWQNPTRRGSSHYGVNELNIGQYVDENDNAWCNSNWDANCRAVSVEIANAPSVTGKTYEETLKRGDEQGWPVTETTLNTSIKLIADIAKRNKLYPLILGKTLKWHSMYTATACPGLFLMGKLQYIVDQANKINATGESDPVATTMYGVTRQVIALSDLQKAKDYAAQLQKEDDGAYYYVLPIDDIKPLRL